MLSFSSLKTSSFPFQMKKIQQQGNRDKDEADYLKQDVENKMRSDRDKLILDLLNKRASTSEAQIQANLARLQYEVKRAQKIDREPTFKRIVELKQKMDSLRERRARERLSQQSKSVISMVGYTNYGKSNELTGAGVCCKDQFFTTMDPVTKKVDLYTNSDAVKFIAATFT
ncbi:unnamed protein product [Lactuca virosa]|uniref:Uncharacterized protein n=1 Tax=Lactuca virosa TaxID=75947 RepID=A0AAU9MDY1_9ASTR|nr:unnamed protein product [Lactuca virosa]